MISFHPAQCTIFMCIITVFMYLYMCACVFCWTGNCCRTFVRVQHSKYRFNLLINFVFLFFLWGIYAIDFVGYRFPIPFRKRVWSVAFFCSELLNHIARHSQSVVDVNNSAITKNVRPSAYSLYVQNVLEKLQGNRQMHERRIEPVRWMQCIGGV